MKRTQIAMIGLLMTALISLSVPRASADLAEDLSSVCDSSGGTVWLRGEYLLWQTSGMKLPPLVTGNPMGTDPAEAGVIGVPSTRILLGDETIFDDARSGYRLSGGILLHDRLGVEGDFFRLEDQEAGYRFDSSSNQILGRPFINLAPLVGPVRWDPQLIYFPPNLTGHVDVAAFSKFYGAGGAFRFNACKKQKCVRGDSCDGCCDSMGGCASMQTCSTLDLTLGYRYLNLDEGIRINERVTSAVDRFDVHDAFAARSIFNGLELGIDYDCFRKSYGFTVFSRIGVGANQNRVQINGSTFIDGARQSDAGGILAQASNIGTREHTVASLMAQLGLNLNVQLTQRLYGNVGYSFLYWGNVVRAGEQIDLNVHPGLFPPYTAVPGTIGALPTHKVSDFFAHGLNVGLTLVL